MARVETGGNGERAGEQSGGLARVIGPRLLFFFILGDMIGGGIYALVGEVALEVGGAVWMPFLVAFVLALLTAGSYAELVTKYPQAAGAALYTHKAFKQPFLTFMVAFAVMASGITSAGALAKAFAGDYFSTFLTLPVLGVSLAFLVVITLINLRGIGESVKLNAAFTMIEIVGLLLIILIGVLAVLGGDAEPGRALEFKEGNSPFLLLIGGATLAFYALIGFEDSVNVAEETHEPSKIFPKALFGGMLAAGIIYLLVTLTATMVVATGQLSGSDAPLLEVVKEGPLPVPLTLFSAIALFAVSNGALINMIMASRLVYGMANQGIVPPVFSKVLPGRRTPWAAIAFTTALCAILIITGDLGLLADTTVMLLLAVFTVVNIAVLVLRKDGVDHDHFHTPVVAPVLGAIVSLVLITQNEAAIFLRAGILLVLGAILYAINRAMSGPHQEVEAERLSG
ncbi:MAG: APC family permease [Actinomycetota bacterium]|nr:APC family permease [Actinomycetota bacterium]